MSNGCGPAWLPNWIKELLFNWFFEASCNKHDDGYEIRRFEYDWKFLQAIISLLAGGGQAQLM